MLLTRIAAVIPLILSDEVPNRGVDRSSRPRRACYPWGNFSVVSSPQQWGHGGSLGPAFASGSDAFRDPVKPAFGLALYSGVLTRLSRSLGPLDIFSRGCRPSRTARLPLSYGLATVSDAVAEGWCYIGAYHAPERACMTAPSYALHPQPHRSNRLQ